MEPSVDDDGSSVTLVFYRVGALWYKEPTLNILAAACQMSTFTHVEIAIGVRDSASQTLRRPDVHPPSSRCVGRRNRDRAG